MPVEVSIIVVTWNARDLIDRCLEAAVGAGSAGVETEVIVVDNASSDDTVAHVRSRWPRVRVVETGANGGMAAGNNAGMAVASGRAYLLLNSDCFLDPGAVRHLLDRLDAPAPERAGVVVPRLRNEDGSLQRSIRGFPTPWRLATEFFFLRRLFPSAGWANSFYAAGFDYDAPAVVDWATGACMLVSRPAIDEVGLMDESYFMYGEEVDWIARMRSAGWVVAFEPSAGAVHLGGGSAGRAWGRMYAVQCANHVVLQARRADLLARRDAHEGANLRAARTTRRIVLAGLRLRLLLARLGLMRSGRGDSSGMRSAFQAAVDAVRELDPARVPPQKIPTWEAPPSLQRAPSQSR